MRRYYVCLLILIFLCPLIFLKGEEAPATRTDIRVGIHYISVTEDGFINIEAHKRDNKGAYFSDYFFKIDQNGKIVEAIELNSDSYRPITMIGFDQKDNLLLSVRNFLYKINFEELQKDVVSPELITTDPGADLYEVVVPFFQKNIIFVYPYGISINNGERWIELSDIHYNLEWGHIAPAFDSSTFTMYRSTLDAKNREVKIEKLSIWKKLKWEFVEKLKIKVKKSSIYPEIFLVSPNYYVFAWDGKEGKNILKYDRKTKKTEIFREVSPECSDCDVVGPQPKILIDDKIICECPMGGYVVFDLKEGKITKRAFQDTGCAFYQPPTGKYLLMSIVSKLYISYDKGENWKEIIDIAEKKVMGKVKKIDIKFK